ncbi:ATP-binding cassette domain-containing protein [Saccharicrinis sp. FJH54]|uniref:ATP-binding cassette domain-containing protein n=1 Tax=Saccharicrinis sp. FJH54 TaxID=3344665 RepID=UPI0035D4349B
MALHHAAFYISNNDNKEQLIDDLFKGRILKPLSELKGELFSDITLKKIIAEEIRHEHFGIIQSPKNSFQKYSEGEKKKLLLQWIIDQEPDYIIVDNIFDHLDVASQESIAKRLIELSQRVVVIQIANRKDDILSFIGKIYVDTDGTFTKYDRSVINNPDSTMYFVNAVPQPIQTYSDFDNPLIEFKNVNVSYDGRPIVKDINWRINQGDFWQLMGPNGSGKSTLLSLINGHNSKAYGQDITLFGLKKGSGESIWEIRKKIGYFSSDMAQQFSRMDSVEHMIISGFLDSIGLYVKPTDIQRERAQEWMNLLRMGHLKKRYFQKLSFGQQRLVLLARAMVKHPPLLILDEPTVGLDDENVMLFNQLINKIAEETSTTILFVSHRKEAGLVPIQIYELFPGDEGSIGRSRK